MVWSLPFLGILGQETSDGQTEVASSSCHSCSVWCGCAEAPSTLHGWGVLLQHSYPSQQHPKAPAAARLLFLGLSAFPYTSFALTLLMTVGQGFILLNGNRISSMLLYGLTKMGCASSRQHWYQQISGGRDQWKTQITVFSK